MLRAAREKLWLHFDELSWQYLPRIAKLQETYKHRPFHRKLLGRGWILLAFNLLAQEAS